ncbi:MAG: SDR family oxidoreductase [Gammaproteobacteria bacterium]|nr:SDR family oxidoreductase [Gammaproteobacteria bacterium]
MNSALDLSGHTALITGGGTGVGFGIARVLHACGATVVLIGRSEAHAESAAELGDRAGALAADISVESDCDRVVRETGAQWGEPDILVNCAAAKPVSFDGALNQRMEDWQRAMDVSLRGTYQMCRAAGAVMVEKGRGSIVNISSIGGFRPLGADMAYTTSKAGVHMITRNLACQWGPQGVRVNCVAVGHMEAGMAVDEDVQDLLKGAPDFAALLGPTPLQRAGTPEEIGWPVAFLVSERASYVNGAILVVDGGQLAL